MGGGGRLALIQPWEVSEEGLSVVLPPLFSQTLRHWPLKHRGLNSLASLSFLMINIMLMNIKL